MDNGALVFIIIIEAIVIVWQASKLKQYQKIETLFSNGTASTVPQRSQIKTGQAASENLAAPVAVPVAANFESTSADSAATNAVADLLAVPGVDPESNIEEAKRVQLVMARCRYAEFYLEQLDDDYERDQFRQIVDSCKATASNIQDPFFRSSALHPIIVLLDRAEWHEARDQLMADVDDELARQRIIEDLSDTEVTSS